jgi:hypothetical protein
MERSDINDAEEGGNWDSLKYLNVHILKEFGTSFEEKAKCTVEEQRKNLVSNILLGVVIFHSFSENLGSNIIEISLDVEMEGRDFIGSSLKGFNFVDQGESSNIETSTRM